MMLQIILAVMLTIPMTTTSSYMHEQTMVGQSAPIGYQSTLLDYVGTSNVQVSGGESSPRRTMNMSGSTLSDDDSEPGFWDDPFMDDTPSTPIGDIPWGIMGLCVIGYVVHQRKQKQPDQPCK